VHLKIRGTLAEYKGSKNRGAADLFLRIDAEVDVLRSGSGRELSGSGEELSDEAVVAALVVVEHLHLDIPVKVAVTKGADGNHEFDPDLETKEYMIEKSFSWVNQILPKSFKFNFVSFCPI